MSGTTARPLQIRGYTLDAILSVYDENKQNAIPHQTKRVFQDIRKELQMVLKQTEQRHKKNDRRRNHNSRHSRVDRESLVNGNTMITRSANTSVDAFKTFQKKYNLILNSLIDSNAGEVSKRLSTLVLQQKAIVGTNKGEMDEKATQLAMYVCQQLVDNASIQAIYSHVYVSVLESLLETVASQEYHTLRAFLVHNVLDIVTKTDPASATKLSAKGMAKFAGHLHLHNQFTRDKYLENIEKWTRALGTNEANVCEWLVHTFLTLAETAASKAQWKDYVKKEMEPLWSDASAVGMRSRIRLWDIRDAYA